MIIPYLYCFLDVLFLSTCEGFMFPSHPFAANLQPLLKSRRFRIIRRHAIVAFFSYIWSFVFVHGSHNILYVDSRLISLVLIFFSVSVFFAFYKMSFAVSTRGRLYEEMLISRSFSSARSRKSPSSASA